MIQKKSIQGSIKPDEGKTKFSGFAKNFKTIIIILIIGLVFGGCAYGVIKYINWQAEIETSRIKDQKKSGKIKIDSEILEEIKDWQYHGTPIDLEKEYSGRDNPFVPY